ncbi:uncharacterized protein Z520_08889 [Fonsecaea multimorphosa CBS 102226]|uniref:LsmAD domain-containing protein n=1 Tax=Fonsecaea multimorphosa CBS 102226 TaxID=1442371 RepID=A0A0D2JPT9_9EURO|nr:uncharacterized protein Z520_08889 [Fonsecaea multimorphosa CBS 102226]KIX95372.1 hypothetical protein Z520_08889 [Fonsecaea multimorphosa CBS 102226]
MRSSSNQKAVDAGRKQSPGGAGGDGISRRPTSQKVWGSSSNSFSQRGSMPIHQNGNNAQPRNTNTIRSTAQRDAGITDKQAHERLMFLFGAAIGLNIVLTSKSGEKFEGLLSGSSLTPTSTKITLKMVRKLQPATSGQANGVASREAALVGSSPEYAMNFDLKDMADMSIADFSLPETSKLTNGSSSTFQTDTDISGNQLRGERELQRWVPEGPDNTDFSLGSLGSGNTAAWDQFATNSQLFGAKSTYDENLYTTTIDRNAPSYKRREAEAERIAREIEGSMSTNAHVREERGQALENDGEDEEEKYSGVRRDEQSYTPLSVGGTNKYTPPARRAPTGQATVPGAPVDPAIISAQLSRPEPAVGNTQKPQHERDIPVTAEKSTAPAPDKQLSEPNGTASTQSAQPEKVVKPGTPTTPGKVDSTNIETQPSNRVISQGPTENVEVKVLHQFRQFADFEKQRVIERRKAQASQDRTAKLNELMRFSKTFKLKTPIPSDLIGILAKDPAKQEAIVERAQKESSESTSPTKASPSQGPAASNTTRKADVPQPQPPVPERQVFHRGRGGIQAAGRSDRPAGQQQPPLFPGRNNSAPYQPRFNAHQQDRKSTQPPPIPAPIPIIEGRVPPTGPMADQAGMTSPQRSNMHTPNSAISGKFNLNVKASEFRPTAVSFSPAGPSQTPSSPGSTQRAGSISRTASPSVFFGNRKPKPASQRPSIAKDFNPIVRMKAEHAPKKAKEGAKIEEVQKDYSSNGGIPNAFQTGPRWTVKPENDQKTYEEVFEKPTAHSVVSPAQSRSSSSHHIPMYGQGIAIPNGPANIPHISTPQHVPHNASHPFPHQYEDGGHRMQYGAATPQVFSSPNMASRQASAYASPMAHPAQLSYQSQPYFGTATGQMPMQMRPYPGTPGMMHAQVGQMSAPMMVQQPSNGPYMAVPQHFNPQMQMYSPNPSQAYPQQNGGYASPGRMAPMMMQQGSQQGHPPAPSMMFSVSNQGAAPMAYPQQQMGMHRGSYGGGHQYGSTPHQGYAMQHRTMSSGYGQMSQKMHHQMQPAHGPAMNGPPQGPAYGQMEGGQDDGK